MLSQDIILCLIQHGIYLVRETLRVFCYIKKGNLLLRQDTFKHQTTDFSAFFLPIPCFGERKIERKITFTEFFYDFIFRNHLCPTDFIVGVRGTYI